MMRALLDVNVLIALLDAAHLHHETARRWLRDNIRYGWATCPITQNGCLRVMTQPAYPSSVPAVLVAEKLREATATDHHHFWPDDVSLLNLDPADWRRIVSARQITDIYLLALAVGRGGRFVTFDARVTPGDITGASGQSLCIIETQN